MITYLDVETTFVVDDNKRTDPSPFNSQNKLVSVQCAVDKESIQFHWFYHKDLNTNTHNSFDKVQQTLDKTTLLVGKWI